MKKRRMTSQRLKILMYLRSVRTHPSAEMVHKAVSRDLPTITLATVYRNLNILADEGEILKITVDNESRFDGFSHHHQHCICRDCGNITDMERKDIKEFALGNIDRKIFEPDSVKIIFHGICKKCSRKEGKYGMRQLWKRRKRIIKGKK